MMPLTISFFDPELKQTLSHSLPDSVKIDLCTSMESFIVQHVARSLRNDEVDCSAVCSTCEQLLASNTQSRVVRCPDCRALFHARCAANCFIRHEPKSLLPSKEGECPVCEKSVLWSDFVRSAFIFEIEDVHVSGNTSSESTEGDEEQSEDELEIIDLENSPTVIRSPAVKVDALPPRATDKPTSLRERLFKKTGNSQLFEI
jgi:DNA-directed RNA polymerase subunit RPC12/RpoP